MTHRVSPMSGESKGASFLEWRVVVFPRGVGRADASRLLTEEAEYGKWELARSVVYHGGMRRVWLKRRAMKVRRSDTLG